MQRRDLLKGGLGATTLASAVIGTGTAGAQDAGQQGINWRMTSSYPKSLDAVYSAGETFIKVLSTITKGRIQIQHLAAGEIVGGLQALDAVQNGTVECCDTAPYYYIGKDPTFAFASGCSLRPQHPPAECLVLRGRRSGPAERRCSPSTTCSACRCGNTTPRWAAGSARRSRPSMT